MGGLKARGKVPGKVRVSGLGVVSALGRSVDELSARCLSGERAVLTGGAALVEEVPLEAGGDSTVRLGRLDRLCRFFFSAAQGAVRDAGLPSDWLGGDRAGICLGTGLGCLLSNEEYDRKVVEQGPAAASPRVFAYTVSSAAAGELSIAYGIRGPNLTMHMGLAAGPGAVAEGCEWIRRGRADVVLAGGADVLGDRLVDVLRDMRLLDESGHRAPFGETTGEICPGEAAVIAVLESEDHAAAREAPVRGWIEGSAAGFQPDLSAGKRAADGLVATLRRALAESGRTPSDVGTVVGGAHGTRVDGVELRALAEVLGDGWDGVVLAPKQALGECFGAAGVVGLALLCGAFRNDRSAVSAVGFDVGGEALPADETRRRLAAGATGLVTATCYSGNVAALVVGAGG